MYRVGAESPNFINESDTIAPSLEGGCPPIPKDLFTPEEIAADEARLFYTADNLPIDTDDVDPGTPLFRLETQELDRFHHIPSNEELIDDPNQLTLTTFEQVVTARHAVISTQDAEHPLAVDEFEGEHGRYSLLDALKGVDKEGHVEYTLFGDDAEVVKDALRAAAERKLPASELREANDPQAHFDAAAAHVIEELHIPAEEPEKPAHDTLTHRIRPLVRRTLAFMIAT